MFGRNLCFGRPFLPEIRSGQQRHIHAADNRSGLKPGLFCVRRRIPVSQRNAARRLLDEALKGRRQGVEVLAIVRQGCRPNLPVKLGVVTPVVERKTEPVQMGLIEPNLGLRNLRGKQVETQNPIDQILKYGSWATKGTAGGRAVCAIANVAKSVKAAKMFVERR